jgi:hypothetical protein
MDIDQPVVFIDFPREKIGYGFFTVYGLVFGGQY